MEESPYMLGSFEFYENVFRIRCGIYLYPDGCSVLDLPHWGLATFSGCYLDKDVLEKTGSAAPKTKKVFTGTSGPLWNTSASNSLADLPKAKMVDASTMTNEITDLSLFPRSVMPAWLGSYRHEQRAIAGDDLYT